MTDAPALWRAVNDWLAAHCNKDLSAGSAIDDSRSASSFNYTMPAAKHSHKQAPVVCPAHSLKSKISAFSFRSSRARCLQCAQMLWLLKLVGRWILVRKCLRKRLLASTLFHLIRASSPLREHRMDATGGTNLESRHELVPTQLPASQYGLQPWE